MIPKKDFKTSINLLRPTDWISAKISSIARLSTVTTGSAGSLCGAAEVAAVLGEGKELLTAYIQKQREDLEALLKVEYQEKDVYMSNCYCLLRICFYI